MGSGLLPKSSVISSLCDEVPSHIYSKISSRAQRIFDQQCKKTFATQSANRPHRSFAYGLLMSDVKIIARGGFDAGDGIDTTFGGGRDCSGAAGGGVRATQAGARLRLLQEPRRADLPRKEGRPHPLRRLPRGFQQQLPSREARTRRQR